ncbi:hypothetical protein [Vibrio hangzhouensis]|uniref:Uncharacterized protein n=1 Tax=Vibrio hangzhouensis TaxID=462991 RepID=A0A1H6AXB7_9VIBR|nr:hypothetical protein [Vibrio hangzhouensis]SEG07422.1 hypothetical protein SAMN04488244_106232 [Vibrio hangzhouensis]SEG53263.1 hypothetical protein SAMN04488244_1181 [Vibrio hangzhouensis]
MNGYSLSKLFDAGMGTLMSFQRASLLGFYALLAIFDLEPLDLQITAAPRSQVILAEQAS